MLDKLDFAFMINGAGAQEGRWLIATDVIYIDLSTDSAVHSVDLNLGPGPVNVSTPAMSGHSSDLKGWVWTLVGGYP